MPGEEIQLLPSGRLVVAVDQRGTDATLPAKVRRAFAEGTGSGLLSLATLPTGETVSALVDFWRDFGAAYLTRLCHAPPSQREGEWQAVEAPDESKLEEWRDRAPPMRGAEYLSLAVLGELWRTLDREVATEVAKHGGALDAWLRERHPLWRRVGRVTFHLAENRNSEGFPFAFLATFTERLARGDRLQYVPLGRAMKQSLGDNDLRRLEALLSPVQAAAERNALARELLDSRRVFRVLPWTPDQAYDFLRAVPDLEAAGVVVQVPDWWSGGRPPRPKVEVTLDAKPGTSVGFDAMVGFDVGVSLGCERLTAEEWEALMEGSAGLVSIKGRWVEIDRPKLQQALDHWRRAAAAVAEGGLTFAQGMRLMAGLRFAGERLGIAALDAALDGSSGEAKEPGDAGLSNWMSFSTGGRLAADLRALSNPALLDDRDVASLGADLQADLRPYQREGVRWLWRLHQLGLGGCLADDMGLGKTLQVIAFLVLRRLLADEGVDRVTAATAPALIVVPASLVGNWKAEFERFAARLRVACAHPSQMPREAIGELLDDVDAAGFDVVVTTYGLLDRFEAWASVPWPVVVLDEAQAIKNPQTAQSRNVRRVAARARCRLALTGTPIENSVTDLWALFDFLNPGLLGSASAFREVAKRLAAGHIDGYAGLRKLVSPYILRRLKTDRSVISDLPDKTEIRVACGLSKPQAKAYQASVRELQEELKEAEGIDRKGLVLSYLMRFKQICNHAALWTGSGNFDPQASGKFRRLREIAAEIAARGEKLLVFTQFREMCAPLLELLEDGEIFGRPGLELHGGTPVGRRQRLVEQFQRDGGPPFFVISLKAGGSGLNLTAASHVLHFDRWWNPAVEDQATDRAYRIGQQRKVLVHKFVCAGTIEERIDRLIAEKRETADRLLGGGEGAGPLLTEMSDEELLDFVAVDLRSAAI